MPTTWKGTWLVNYLFRYCHSTPVSHHDAALLCFLSPSESAGDELQTIGDLQEDLAEAQAKAAALGSELAEEKAKAAALTSRLREEHINAMRLEGEKENFKEAMKASMPDPARMEDALNDYFDERNWEHDGDAATDEELGSDMMDI